MCVKYYPNEVFLYEYGTSTQRSSKSAMPIEPRLEQRFVAMKNKSNNAPTLFPDKSNVTYLQKNNGQDKSRQLIFDGPTIKTMSHLPEHLLYLGQARQSYGYHNYGHTVASHYSCFPTWNYETRNLLLKQIPRNLIKVFLSQTDFYPVSQTASQNCFGLVQYSVRNRFHWTLHGNCTVIVL